MAQVHTDDKAVVHHDDSEKASTGYANSTAGADFAAAHSADVRKLFLKLDLVILPFAILLYLSAYLDRGNLGNARLQGLEAQALNGSDDKYSLALALFYVTYIVLSTPGTLMAQQFDPSRMIAAGALIWSIAASCQAAVTNPAGVYVCRLFVGIGEAFFGQAMVFYLSLWYPRTYLAKRVGIFISAGAVAGAFGGLIAFGVAKIQNSSIAQWRILFLIEGLPSAFLAIMVFFFLPSRPESSRFLNEQQRTTLLTLHNQGANVEHSRGIYWAGVKRAALNPITYIISIAYSCNNLDLSSVSGFLPTIVKNLGYTNADAQLYTVPPYCTALLLMIVLCTYSDRFKSRGIPAAICFAVNLVGWAILISTNPNGSAGVLHARYFACHCVTAGAYACIPILAAFASNNCPDQSQRAFQLGMLNTIGQCLSVLGSYSFPSNEGPKYIKGAALNIAFSSLGIFLSLGLSGYYRLVNRSRDRKEHGQVAKPGEEEIRTDFDKAAGFRYTP